MHPEDAGCTSTVCMKTGVGRTPPWLNILDSLVLSRPSGGPSR